MSRDEIALRLVVTALARPDCAVRLENPIALTYTTLPPPGIYSIVQNALMVADWLLAPKVDRAVASQEKPA